MRRWSIWISAAFGLLTVAVILVRVARPADLVAKPAQPARSVTSRALMQGCSTPFALKELKDVSAGVRSCVVPDNMRSKWKPVPMLAATSQGDSTDGKGNDAKKQLEAQPTWRVTKERPQAGSSDKREPAGVRGVDGGKRPNDDGTTDAFCVYEWQGDNLPSNAEFAALGAKPECGISVGMSEPAAPTPAVRNDAALFEREARGIAASSLPKVGKVAKLEAGPAARPRVAVIDATPFGVSKRDRYNHGYAVSRVIASLACADPDSASCEQMIRPYYALRYVIDKSGRLVLNGAEDGGVVGTFHDLFQLMRRALDEKAPGEHLIMNLSLGWDPVKTDPDSIEVRQMGKLLARAYCEGVLVIVAAGNSTGSEGATVPASFEAEPPPDSCSKAGLGTYRPLVHAVGAVNQYDQRLALSRPWSQPRLDAYGLQVTVPTKAGYTTVMSGSSISAAIVSGIASVVWSARPKLDAAEVMDVIYKGARKIDPASGGHIQNRTELCAPGKDRGCEKWPVRRANLCGALNAAIPSARLTCEPALTSKLAKMDAIPPGTEEPCRVAGCGIPLGPMQLQLPHAVLPMPAPASCGTCSLALGSALGRTIGTVSGTPDFVDPSVSATLVRAWADSSSFQDYNLAVPQTLLPFSKSYFMQNNPSRAQILWIVDVGTNVVATTELMPNP